MTAQSLCDQAIGLHQQGRLEEAGRLYGQALAADANAFLPRHLLGILKLQQGRNDEAVALIGAALTIQPGHAEALVNYGIALKQCGRDVEALASFDQALAAKPDHAGAPYNRAILLAERGRTEEALEAYGAVLALKPDFIEALNERAALFQTMNRHAAALADFDRLLALKPGHGEAWSNRGVVLEEMNRFDEALASIDRALALTPNSAEALHNKANILSRFKRHDEALAHYDRALAIKPNAYARAWTNRAILLTSMKRFAEARESFSRALAIDPDDVAALQHRGNLVWLEFRDFDAALSDLERAVALKPGQPNLLGDLVYVKMQCGDWRDRARDKALLDDGVRSGKTVVQPFIYQALSESPADLQACAVIHSKRHFSTVTAGQAIKRDGKIRIGYLSGEFRQQATAYLTAGLYECHDKSKFEVTAFDNGVSDNSPTRHRLEAAFGKFRNIANLSDAAAAALIADDGIDILVNLNGYFGAQRTEIFAARPAPIMDYIIADPVVIPENERRYFTEKSVYLPNSYQVNDFRRALPGPAPARIDCGLPGHGFVFCSFNASYKLSPEIFDCWLAILKETPGSVLWLMEGAPRFAENIRRAAEAKGLDANRIIFAPFAPMEKHLARLQLADLFLDTLPCNAHTTASDALWAGLPLITCRGTAFCGRVAASALGAIGLPELITEDLSSYRALAIRLAREPAYLAGLREKLARNRMDMSLFDTARYCRQLEAAYARMVELSRAGLAPESFAVPQ